MEGSCVTAHRRTREAFFKNSIFSFCILRLSHVAGKYFSSARTWILCFLPLVLNLFSMGEGYYDEDPLFSFPVFGMGEGEGYPY